MTILTVGPGQQYSTIGAAVAASKDGDVVQVQAGTYTNDFVTVTKDITLEGVGGMVHMVATVPPPNGKAIMTVNGDVTVRNFEFSGAKVRDGNGAGIRYEGGDLTVENSYFHHNENGLLANPDAGGSITIRNSEFAYNGKGDGYTHNLYVNAVGSLTIEDSYFHDANVGHEIKSRALNTTITGTRIHDNGSTASYSVDLPNGGKAVLSGNTIQQGPNSQNPAIVAFGAEGGLHAGSSLTMTDNTVINDLGSSSAKLLLNPTSIAASISGTDVFGLSSGQLSSGPASITGTTYLASRPVLDTASPWLPDGAQTLDGAAAAETLAGGAGNDLISGYAGDDCLAGLAGNDTLRGGAGSDRLVGGDGGDFLAAGNGNDTIAGGTGNDTMSGGDGNDRFTLAPGLGNDRINGFDAEPTGGQDLLDISAFGVTAANFTSQVAITQQAAGTLVSAGSGSVLLAGVNAASISVSDFVLASSAPATATLALAPTAALAVAPTVLTFDEFVLSRGAEQRLSGTYGGFTWAQTGIYRPDGSLGYKTASGNNLAFFGEATGNEVRGYEATAGNPIVIRRADGGDFTFSSAAFSSAFNTNLQITAEAFDDGARVGTYTFVATRGTAAVVSFDGQSRFSSIDELRFDAPNYFGFDNFTFLPETTTTVPPTLAITAANASRAEGAAGTTTPFTFTVTRSGDTSGASTVAWTVGGTGTSAASASDFAGGTLPAGTLSFAAGQASRTITVNVAGDGTVEGNETFAVTLSGATGATIATGSATGTIQNDDVAATLPTLAIAAANASRAEGAAGTTTPFTFTVTRSGDTSGASTVAWTVGGTGTSAASASDFAGGTLPAGTLSFAAGQASQTITINVTGDGTVEGNETFAVTLSGATGATIATGSAIGTIQNDDVAATLPTLAIAAANASRAEGAAGTTTPFTFTVTRSGDTSGASTVAWAVSGTGTSAASASDFAGGTLPAGTLSFAAGQASRTITVNVAGDGTVEGNEAFAVTLSGATGATIATGSATGTIQNDDTTSGGGSGTPVVDFALQNTAGAASKAQYVQFMQVFAQGTVPSGSDLYAEVGGQKVPTQMEVTQRYADGSVKAAVITLYEPPIAAGTTLEGRLVIGQGATGPDLPANASIAAGYNLAVNMDIQGVGAVRIDAAAELTKAIAAGKAEILMQGPLATEVRVDVYVTSSLHITLDITTFADGSINTQVQFNNDRAMTSTGGTIRYNSISITQDGQTKFSYGALTQYQYQTWKIDVADNTSVDQTLNVLHDIDHAEQTATFQNYDLGYNVSTTTLNGYANAVKATSWTEVLGVNGLVQYMPQTGGRPDIGPTTTPNAVWLITQDQRAADYALGQASAAGSVPWHMYDPVNGTYVSLENYPNIWFDYRAGPGTGSTALTQQPSGSTGWTPETAHAPDLSYTAYMLTGDRYYLDQLNAQASWAIATAWHEPRQRGNGIIVNDNEQVRTQAWTMRVIDEAAWANPDGSAEQAYFSEIAANNWAYLAGRIPTLTQQQGEIHGIVPGNYRDGSATAPWQQDFFASTAAQAALRGNEDAREVLKWQANFLSGRFLSPDLDPHNGYAYSMNVYVSSTSTQYLKTWAAVQSAMQANGNAQTDATPSSGYYAELALMSNAEIITVFAGGDDPTDHAVAANAMKAYGWLLYDNDPYLRSDPQYQIVPRMPDGTQMSADEMYVSTAAGIVSFGGAQVFIYHAGANRAELRGTSGADILIDRTNQGGDTLVGGAGGDYLIGGAGTNLFTPGGGADYVVVGKGAATIQVDPTLAGRLEVAGFRPGTDRLDLLLSADGRGADILGTAVQDAYGGTVMTVSPGVTLVLDGVLPSQLSTAIFI